MNVVCDCGTSLDAPSDRTACEECGTPGCHHCAIQIDATLYCRWCATALAEPA